MGWNPEHRYKLLGKLVHANGKYLIAFDLTAVETYKQIYSDGKKTKKSSILAFVFCVLLAFVIWAYAEADEKRDNAASDNDAPQASVTVTDTESAS